jgi:glycosyltransferase involved in cell wall biosynthesis
VAVLLPSARESLSLLALEAWAVGRPILFNAESAVVTAQSTRSGGGIAYRGAADLAGAAGRLLDDPGLADAAGASGRAFVLANYTWANVHERLAALVDAGERPRR